MSVKYFFGLPYLITKLDIKPSSVNYLSNKALDLKEKNSGKTISNVGGFHSEIYPIEKICNGEAEDVNLNILNSYNNFINYIYNNLENISLDQIKTESWLNINYSTSFNSTHEHTPSGSMFSAVFYVQVPLSLNDGEGCLVFEDLMYPHPRNTIGLNQPFYRLPQPKNQKIKHNININPSNGNLLIFPSSLFHAVSATSSKEIRISLAINFIDPRFEIKTTHYQRRSNLY